uniref:Uncharacterized protein n=1 Tax=Anguilla anguilla TaxID=7936 RepID=A0A0E9RY56_ANGAN
MQTATAGEEHLQGKFILNVSIDILFFDKQSPGRAAVYFPLSL